MNNTFGAAAVAVILGGCAAPQASVGNAGSAPSASTYYCAKDRLNVNGGQLECNWQPTVDLACSLTKATVLERASLASDPQPAGRCSTGVWLVKAMPR
jgi:hypothetical protein